MLKSSTSDIKLCPIINQNLNMFQLGPFGLLGPPVVGPVEVVLDDRPDDVREVQDVQEREGKQRHAIP